VVGAEKWISHVNDGDSMTNRLTSDVGVLVTNGPDAKNVTLETF